MTWIAGLVVVLPFLVGSSSGAQANRPPQELERIAVVNFGPWKSAVGPRASEALRLRLDRATRGEFWVLPRADIEGALTNDTEPNLEPTENDAVQLARMMRAELIVRGTVRDSGGVVRIDATLLLSADPALRQPLGPYMAPTVDGAVALLARELVRALAQFPGAQECRTHFRRGNYARAVEAARAAEGSYPRGTLARACRLRAMSFGKASAGAVLSLADSILAGDSANPIALANASDVHLERGDTARAVALRARLFALRPWKPETCVGGVSSSPGHDPIMRAVLRAVLQRDSVGSWPLTVAWELAQCERDWPTAIRVAQRLEVADSTFTDAAFYMRLAAAYTADSQPARGAAAIRSALAIDPRVPRARLLLAQLHGDLNQPDSALAALRAARTAGDDPDSIAQAAIALGSRLLRETRAGQNATDRRMGFLRAHAFHALADTLDRSGMTVFLVGASAFELGLGYAHEAEAAVKAKRFAEACAASRAAVDYLDTALMSIPLDGNPHLYGRIFRGVEQYRPSAERWRKEYCG